MNIYILSTPPFGVLCYCMVLSVMAMAILN